MSLLDSIRKLWRSVTPRTRSDVEEEFSSTLDAYQEDLIRQGLSEEEARRKARIDLGQPAAQNETYRDAIGLRLFDEFGGDIRYGFRALRRNPGFAAVAVLSLALGIGATTAMFSLIYATFIHPFPYADSDRIMNPDIITEEGPAMAWFAMVKSQFEVLNKARSIESLLGFSNDHAELTGEGLPEDVAAVYLTENADTFFGVRAMLGRGIQPSDADDGGQRIAVLNYHFWQRHFHGDRAVIGRTLQLNHVAYTIAGVMPRAFAFNDTFGVGDVYLPKSLQRGSTNPPIRSLYTPWIKLKANVSRGCGRRGTGCNRAPVRKGKSRRLYQEVSPAFATDPCSYEQNAGHALALLLAGVLLLLAIGCANCSILLLARGRRASRSWLCGVRLGPAVGGSSANCWWKRWSFPFPARLLELSCLTGWRSYPCNSLLSPFLRNL